MDGEACNGLEALSESDLKSMSPRKSACFPAVSRVAEADMSQRVIFVDVDDTLVRSAGSKRIPISTVIEKVRSLHAEGVVLYVWSSGGAEYARAAAKELGLESCFVAFLSKPNAYIDDQPVHEWRYCKHVLPGNAEHA
jgi:predicted HAD superfamily phosphohydrolase YqeG